MNQISEKEIIRQGIKEHIDFQTLRSLLPTIRKRVLLSLIFDVMDEMGLKQLPFPGMMSRPTFTHKPIPVQADGTLNIYEVLKEKGFEDMLCEAKCHVGENKITLTIKPVKHQPIAQVENKQNSNTQNYSSSDDHERMDFSNY